MSDLRHLRVELFDTHRSYAVDIMSGGWAIGDDRWGLPHLEAGGKAPALAILGYGTDWQIEDSFLDDIAGCDASVKFSEYATANGGELSAYRFGQADRTLRATYIGRDASGALGTIRALAGAGIGAVKLCRLVVDDDPESWRYFQFYVKSVSTSTGKTGVPSLSLMMGCPNPLMYSVRTSSETKSVAIGDKKCSYDVYTRARLDKSALYGTADVTLSFDLPRDVGKADISGAAITVNSGGGKVASASVKAPSSKDWPFSYSFGMHAASLPCYMYEAVNTNVYKVVPGIMASVGDFVPFPTVQSVAASAKCSVALDSASAQTGIAFTLGIRWYQWYTGVL
nr:MAG TPA: tail protein [Caudoviricetes sp.]